MNGSNFVLTVKMSFVSILELWQMHCFLTSLLSFVVIKYIKKF